MSTPEQAAELVAKWPLERLFTDTIGFAQTTATPVQRATCRVLDGRALGELEADLDVASAIGAVPPLTRFREAYLVSAIRGGKSQLAAATGVKMAASCDLSRLGQHEIARVSINSLDRRKAGAVMEHLRGAIERPLVGQMACDVRSDSVLLAHPSGRRVLLEVVAGKRAGAATIAFWSAGAIFDEATRMLGQDDGIVNIDEALRALRGRLLPGAMIVCSGSPWAPRGPVYEAVQKYWQKPADGVVVIRGTGPQMNPSWWTPERCEELKARDPQAYRTDVLAEFVDEGSSFFDPRVIDSAIEPGLELARVPVPGEEVTAGGDVAFRRNSSALCIVHRAGALLRVADLLEMKPDVDSPLRPSQVIARFIQVMKAHGTSTLVADDHYREAVSEYLDAAGMSLTPIPSGPTGIAQMYLKARTLFNEGRVRLPAHAQLIRQLKAVGFKAQGTGGISIIKPTDVTGAHGDVADAVICALWQAGGVEVEAPKPQNVASWEKHWQSEHVTDPIERALLEEQEREERERRYG